MIFELLTSEFHENKWSNGVSHTTHWSNHWYATEYSNDSHLIFNFVFCSSFEKLCGRALIGRKRRDRRPREKILEGLPGVESRKKTSQDIFGDSEVAFKFVCCGRSIGRKQSLNEATRWENMNFYQLKSLLH